MTPFLDEIKLKRMAPSIFADHKADATSDHYGFIPTISVLRGLAESGFHPVRAMQSNCRSIDKKNFAKHIVTFRHESTCEKGGVLPEIVMVNSHDGSCSYQLRAGIYRLVCTNGLIVGDEVFCRRVRHSGNVVDKVVEAAQDLIEIVPISVRKASDWQDIKLSQDQKVVFAQTAMSLKWDGDEFPITPNQVLSPRRIADSKDDLWTTFNVVQENVIRGGVKYRTPDRQRRSTRGVNSVNENVRLNTALWTLTEKMAELLK